MSTRSMILIVLSVIALSLISDAVFTVKQTERAVLLRFGALQAVDLSPGLHFKIPFADEVKIFDGRVLTLDSSPQRYFTVEKKPLNVDAYVKWQVAEVDKYYTATSGDEVNAQRRLEERVKTGLRNQISRRDMYEVVSGERDELMKELTDELAKVMNDEFGVNVLDVRVKRIELPEEVGSSVFQRMNAEREVLAREHRARGREMAQGIRADADRQAIVVRAEAGKTSDQIRGEGDATAAALYANAYNRDPEFYEFTRSLRAYRNAFSGKDDMLVLDPSSDFFKYLGSQTGKK
ncbi:MAG TPA: protease modulator HflC [Pseudomonadales bacterium]|nr:protease modulator HflC [Pseudomonadales bacterium]